MTNKEIRDNIRDIAERENGIQNVCDVQVSIVNLRKRKHFYIVDVIFTTLDKGSERHTDWKYPREVVERVG